MPTIIPYSESVRRAVAYILEELAERPEQPVSALMDAAGSRFNLGPLDYDALRRLLAESTAKNGQS